MKKNILFACILSILSCTPSGVKQKTHQKKIIQTGREDTSLKSNLHPTKSIGTKQLTNGIKLTYFKRGEGQRFKSGEVAKINYEVLLEDGTFVDGNKLLNKKWLPFLVGFGMQTPGWDIVFNELKVGDFVEIYLPSEMARGKVGIKGLIPPNSNNIIRLRVMDKLEPTRVIDGTKVWLLEENKNEKNIADEESEIEFHYIVGSKSHPRYDISYRRNQPYLFRFSDFGIVKGLKKTLINAKKSDKLWIVIPPSEAYGNKGLEHLVKPNEPIFYDIFILDIR